MPPAQLLAMAQSGRMDQPPIPEFLTVADLARLTCRSPKTIRNAVYRFERGEADIPTPHRLNGRILFRIDEVREWIERGVVRQAEVADA